jgi:hypothetical protein
MFRLFLSRHQVDELKEFYKQVLHMKLLSWFGDPIRLYPICLTKRYLLKAKY